MFRLKPSTLWLHPEHVATTLATVSNHVTRILCFAGRVPQMDFLIAWCHRRPAVAIENAESCNQAASAKIFKSYTQWFASSCEIVAPSTKEQTRDAGILRDAALLHQCWTAWNRSAEQPESLHCKVACVQQPATQQCCTACITQSALANNLSAHNLT